VVDEVVEVVGAAVVDEAGTAPVVVGAVLDEDAAVLQEAVSRAAATPNTSLRNMDTPGRL
jgi:hypothetical protein